MAALVADAAAGSQQAWDGLVARYNRLVWAVARSFRLSEHDAADVVQTTWLRLVEHLGALQHPERVGSVAGHDGPPGGPACGSARAVAPSSARPVTTLRWCRTRRRPSRTRC